MAASRREGLRHRGRFPDLALSRSRQESSSLPSRSAKVMLQAQWVTEDETVGDSQAPSPFGKLPILIRAPFLPRFLLAICQPFSSSYRYFGDRVISEIPLSAANPGHANTHRDNGNGASAVINCRVPRQRWKLSVKQIVHFRRVYLKMT